MATSAQSEKIYNMPIKYFVGLFRDINPYAMEMTLQSEHQAGNSFYYTFFKGVSLVTCGETINITLTPEGNSTKIHVMSDYAEPPVIEDFSTNIKNVKTVFNYIDYSLNKDSIKAQPVNASVKRANFCMHCGTRLPLNAQFCPTCGKRVGG